MRYLIGIDDTDNLESRGTGFRARCLGQELADAGFGELTGISRHQLYVHPDIRYTSHNSSLCLGLDSTGADTGALVAHCREFLRRESADGSDAAFCIADAATVAEPVHAYGRRAKSEVLTQTVARELAAAEGFHLEGVTGDEGGVIGALAAVGLRHAGNDGRFVWVRRVRDLSGALSTAELLQTTGIDVIRTLAGEVPPDDALISIEPWPRPVLLDGRAVLLVQQAEKPDGNHDWELVPREIIRGY